MPKLTDAEYLDMVLHSKKMELDSLNITHRVAIAVYEAKKQMLQSQIDSIVNQLQE